MQSEVHDNPVYLGFVSPLEDDELYRLAPCFFPVGKIGGKPSWLNPVNIPRTEDLICKCCSKPMAFLLQVYATKDDDSSESFHRTLFLFICKDPNCSKVNDSSNMGVFRCCLPRVNAFYPDSGPLDADLIGLDELPPPHSDAPSLCRICGCFASKKCAKCGAAWYCSREHQALDWTGGHRSSCGQPLESASQASNPLNSFLFEEMGMELDVEQLKASMFEEEDDDESDEEEEGGDEKRTQEYLDMVKEAKNRGDSSLAAEDLDDAVEEKKDHAFNRFNRLLQLNPEQILRYSRGGHPLATSDSAPPLSQIPSCACGSPRQFELQLTPHLLSLLGVDSIGCSIDWASVYVYTCRANCTGMEGYSKELVIKHDFM